MYDLGGWFVIPLFLIQVFNVLFRKMIKKISIRINEYFIFTFYLVLGLIGVYLGEIEYNKGIWLVLDRFLRILPLYGLGILYKKKLEKIDKLPSILYFSFLLFAQLIIITFNGGKQITVVLEDCRPVYRFLLTPYIVSFMGIAFWLRISNVLLPVIKDSKLIKIVCDNAYSIMINQYAGFMLIKTIWALMSKYTNFNLGFDMAQYKGNINYFYNPNNQFAITYLIAGIVVPIIMQLVINKIKTLIFKV